MSFPCWCACETWLILLAFTSVPSSLVKKVKALAWKQLCLFLVTKRQILNLFLLFFFFQAIVWIILLKRKHCYGLYNVISMKQNIIYDLEWKFFGTLCMYYIHKKHNKKEKIALTSIIKLQSHEYIIFQS